MGGPAPGQGLAAESVTPAVAALSGSSILVRNSDGDSTWESGVGDDLTPPSLTVRAGSDGTLLVDPATFVAPLSEACPATNDETEGCLALRVRGSGPSQVMVVDTQTGSVRVPMNLVVEADAIRGYEGMPADCQLGPISGTLVARDYTEASGTATLVALDRPLALTMACGEYNELFNSLLGLPGVVDTILFARITLPPP